MKIENYNKPILFYSLSTIIPWLVWFLAAYISNIAPASSIYSNLASIIAFIGLLAPLAVIYCISFRNKDLLKDVRGRFFNFKNIGLKYIFLACFIMLASILLAQLISLFFGYSVNQFHFAKSFSFSSGVFPVWFMLIIAPVLEELVWHSYGTDCLGARFSLFHTSLLFGLFWGIWHFPLSFIKDYYHSNLVETGWLYSLNFLVSLFPFVLIMNWLYYKAKRNILVPMVFHITAGFFNEIFATQPMSKVIQTGILLLLSAFLLLREKDFFLKRPVGSSGKFFKLRLIPNKNYINGGIYPMVFVLVMICITVPSYAQSITQTMRGKVLDIVTQEPLPFATIAILDTNPTIGATADLDGNFILAKVPVGRRNVRISMLGYESYLVSELLVNSGKEVLLSISLQKSTIELAGVMVRVSKDAALNTMTTLSARQFTAEETQRYAGGLDDPARLVSSFAGVATPSVSSNGISVRGNNPDGLLWRIEGVEVPTPSHFANLSVAGGGLLTAISSQMMGSSDFYTGAFPAEYGNVTSGVFDIKLNSGNSSKRQFTIQAGIIGVDFAAQGPFRLGKNATYNMNYRNSTMALLAPILPDNSGILKYQDVSFKMNFPTKKAGIISFWGIGALDGIEEDALDSLDWESNSDRDNSETKLYMFASGLSHRMSINSRTFIHTTLSASGNGLSHNERRLDIALQAHPQSKAENNSQRYTFQSFINKRFNENHSNKTGVDICFLGYNLNVEKSMYEGAAPLTIADKEGHSSLLQIYSQSKIELQPNLTLNLGVNALYFMLNKNYSIEPRVGFKYHFNSNQSLAFAYGLHSRIEQLQVYFIEDNGKQPNKGLKNMKSAHYVFSYNLKLNDNLHLCIEPYYQYLTNIPVAPGSYVSTINNVNNLFFNESLVSKGKGRNIGMDLSLERFLYKGFYYLITASVFDSKYMAADGIERNTRFNKNYVFNVAVGKEWEVKENNILGANVRLNYLGGNRKEPIDESTSNQNKSVVYGETNGKIAFNEKYGDSPVFSFTLSYRKNKPKYSSVWTLQVLNAAQVQEHSEDYYNIKTGKIDTRSNCIMIPNLSYKIEF